LLGSIIGVGISNQLMSVRSGTSGVDWGQAANVGKSLLISPIVGFICAGLLLLVTKVLVKDKKLYQAPAGSAPPPFWIRGLLMLTCTGVSFFHGSNDGQKGMGLIMLILIGTVPTTYALNHAITPTETQDFIAVSRQAADSLNKYVEQSAAIGDPRDDVTDFMRSKEFQPNTMLAMRTLINDVGTEMAQFKDLKNVPNDQVRNFRNDMYLTSEALRILQKSGKPEISTADAATLKNYKGRIDKATRFIPLWVKVAAAIALGLGTMVGWKRIVVTVGEKIGKNHLTYAQGAAAEITAMATIGAADYFGLPVSTTHVLSSGVAGTMAANHSDLQWGTVRNLLMAWVLTLPVAMTLSGFLFWTFRKLF
jgi:PiT family inorganic phosphate transporter